ncbi:CocE/NonD family hydrolase [Sphingomonas sp. CGMCC 1.13654]|uniref:CocE/NonD family hydrolase n=1 Tax=Sphingomonas chungangi TaxID=2683589 RepID=A0A838L4E5_9SPHN|nr:CocE/NonD family hydrolase [Sphingomonas chungangi]MBA2933897.1 CocE/NonD family hydrolase [Sphingomonas chungangi]MVW55226.1 CocE/NonD family hydrolase [Sphingomonas chungangi]
MQIDWDVPIPMEDGTLLRADVFRPDGAGLYPVIMTHGVYGKGLPIERFRQRLLAQRERHPLLKQDDLTGADLADAMTGGSGDDIASDDYRVWEVVDPLHWVPAGYVCVRVDSRGSGRSPGRLDPLSPQEIRDYAACIEWAGTQPWSNGKVGLCGKSYYAMSQWLVAALKPPHLAAICVWHGWSDWYRDATRHGGILYRFWENFWYPELALPVQNGADAGVNPHNGLAIAGACLDVETLVANRADIVEDIRTHPFDDDHYYGVRTPDLKAVDVPLLASADWSDHDLHLAGTIRGYLECASREKRLEIHAGGQFDDAPFVAFQQRFFDHYLKGEGDWLSQPPVQLAVRQADGGSRIAVADGWPIPDTRWTKLHLDAAGLRLADRPPMRRAEASFEAGGDGLVFETAPFNEDILVAGPIAATLQLSSDTADADLFLVLDAVDAEGKRVELRDHRGGLTSMTVGWQRASHRALEPKRSTIGAPWPSHRHAEPLVPGQIYEVHVALRPGCLYLPAGHRLQLTVRGNGPGHDDPVDRPAALFDNEVKLHTGLDAPATLMLPVVPPSVLRYL